MRIDHSAENVFGSVAELYEDVRPEYPQQLVADVLEWGGLTVGGRILEIGCGTGKATRLFAPYGFSMTCIDPSAGMLAVARRTCAQFGNAGFVETKFEEWELPPTPFDLVFSAQAFHWIDPSSGIGRVAEALRRGGALALFWHQPDRTETPLRLAIDAAYKAITPDMRSPAPGVRGARRWSGFVSDSGLFEDVETREYEWEHGYDADTWVRFLQTTSDHRVLPAAQLERLLTAVHDAIELHGGVYLYRVVTDLLLARKS